MRAHRWLEARCGPLRAYLFNGFDPAYGIPAPLQAFYRAMERYGMTVRLHPMDPGPVGTNRQRRVDVDLAAHLVWQASLSDVSTLVLTTGDQDLLPAVEIARERFDKKVVLFTYDQNVHHELAASVDDWWLFEDEEARLARRA